MRFYTFITFFALALLHSRGVPAAAKPDLEDYFKRIEAALTSCEIGCLYNGSLQGQLCSSCVDHVPERVTAQILAVQKGLKPIALIQQSRRDFCTKSSQWGEDKCSIKRQRLIQLTITYIAKSGCRYLTSQLSNSFCRATSIIVFRKDNPRALRAAKYIAKNQWQDSFLAEPNPEGTILCGLLLGYTPQNIKTYLLAINPSDESSLDEAIQDGLSQVEEILSQEESAPSKKDQ